jgi:hypothetical protein
LLGCIGKIIRQARKVAVGFVGGTKPVQPHTGHLACIALSGTWKENKEMAKVCFDLSSFCMRGVMVSDQFYELRKSSSQGPALVQGSKALECGEGYLDLFD